MVDVVIVAMHVVDTALYGLCWCVYICVCVLL